MKLFTVTYYKLKMMLSDKFLIAAMVIIPLFITITTGYALRHEKLNTIPLAFVDEDGSAYSSLLIQRLKEKEGLQLHLSDRKKAVEMLKSNKVEAVFVIKEGFEERITLRENDGIIEMLKSPASYSSVFIQEVVAGEVIRFTSSQLAADWVARQYSRLKLPSDTKLKDEVISKVDAQWEPEPLMTVNYVELDNGIAKKTDRVYMPAATATSAGIIVVFIMLYVLFSSGWIIEERRNGTLKRLVSGPDALGYSFLGSVISLAISGTLQLLLFGSINKLVFKVDLFPGFWSYVIFGAYLFSVIGISMFLSAILRTPAQLQAGAPVFALLSGFAGGCFWNFVEVSEGLKRLSLFTPQGWALEGINRLLINSGDFGGILLSTAVLLSMALILLPLSYMIIKSSVEK